MYIISVSTISILRWQNVKTFLFWLSIGW
jgi:hypothetical protein